MSKNFIINDENFNKSQDLLFPKDMGRGLVERDYSVHPVEMFAPPSEMDIIPQSEWDARIDEQEELQSSPYHIWCKADNGKLPANLYQNGQGYCWAHSSVNAVMVSRAVANLPYVPLSAYMVAVIIKNGRDQGGWCGESAKFLAEIGTCSQKTWPQQNMSLRMDTPEAREEAKQYRITEEWRDLSRPIYGQQMTFEQVASCLLRGQPVATDFNWWGHSVCSVQLVRIERGSYGLRIANSWGSSWGENGFGILQGSKARPDGAVGVRNTMGA